MSILFLNVWIVGFIILSELASMQGKRRLSWAWFALAFVTVGILAASVLK